MSKYFTYSVPSETNLYEDIIVESLDFMGTDIFYIPRTLVAKDEILGEDRLSEFKNKYPIRAYLEQIDNFDGQGAFIQKFGLQMEQSGTFTVAKRTWLNSIGRMGTTILPNRPCEGDLIYWPINKGLFEIKFVNYQNPFYQLGKLYVYRLEVELFQYASEHITTGMEAIDKFETLKSLDISLTSFTPEFGILDDSQLSDQVNVDLNGIVVEGVSSTPATPIVPIVVTQKPNHLGDNELYRTVAPTIGFDTNGNVFGDV